MPPLWTLLGCLLLAAASPGAGFWFTDTNFQATLKSGEPAANGSPLDVAPAPVPVPTLTARVPEVAPSLPGASPALTKENGAQQCACSADWFERQLDASIRKQFTEYFVKIADEELKKEARAKNLSEQLFGPYRQLIPLFDRLLLLNRLRSDPSLLGAGGRAPLLQPAVASAGELEEIWINFRSPSQQQLEPAAGAKSNHVASAGDKSAPKVIGRVRDREALFDMKSPTEDRLVLVESEQLLVVNTGMGWRPLQMQPALRDFRRGLAKYGLRTSEERKRLIESAPASSSKANPRTPPGRSQADYLTKARESDATMPNYYHDRSYTVAAGDAAVDRQDDLLVGDDVEDDDDDDDEDEEDEEDEEEVEEVDDETSDDGNDYLTGAYEAPAKRPGGKSRHREMLTGASSTVAPEPLRIRSTPATPVQVIKPILGGAGRFPAGGAGQRAVPARRGDQSVLQLRMAALNEPFSGAIHGIRGADFECSKAARKAAIKGSFKAFLASGYQSLNELLRHNVRSLPIVNLRNEELANSWTDLFSKPGKLMNPLSRVYSFDGRLVATDSNWPNKLVWHGAASASGQRHHLHQCDGWHSGAKAKFGMATPLHAPRALVQGSGVHSKRKVHHKRFTFTSLLNQLNQTAVAGKHPARHLALDGLDKFPCSMPLIVFCIETAGQVKDSSMGVLDNYFDMDSRNMS